MTDTLHPRTVRSFVRREGRITEAQQRALEELWPRFGLDHAAAPLDLDAVFGRHAPCILEIGFGMGGSLLELAERHPENDYLGIEVHRPGLGSILSEIDRRGLANLRVMEGDAVEILNQQIPDGALDAVYLFFPDPWPKKRHHKRRLVQPPFVALIARKLRPGGIFHLATDWEHYATQMLDVVSGCPRLRNTAGPGLYAPRPEYRPLTKFEQRGQRLGHGVWDLIFEHP